MYHIMIRYRHKRPSDSATNQRPGQRAETPRTMNRDLAAEIVGTRARGLASLETTDLKHDLTGCHFGRLFTVSFSHIREKRSFWVAACSCGNVKTVSSAGLRSGSTKSCGCLHRETAAAQGRASRTHGLSKSRLSVIHSGMITRCYKPNAINYDRYGGKGVTVCDEWRFDRWSFFKWALANGYRDDLEIDRIENDKGYEPGNCRWVKSTKNQNNRSNNRLITIEGVTKTLADWSKISRVAISTIRRRMTAGMAEQEAIMRPSDKPWLTALARQRRH
jgi:hypothetical protein